jgi:mannose-1-phosphate guanylyltransferase
MKIPHLQVFILAGGSGERFWPMSRRETPKHLLRLLGERTLLEETVARFAGLVDPEQIFILTNARQLASCRAALPDLPEGQFIGEPEKRDTAPAIALANAVALARDSKAICAFFPADAMIHDVAAFQRTLSDAVEIAQREDALVTVAIPPKYPATGFGYLELAEELVGGKIGSRVQEVNCFVEKPAQALAESYVASGQYAWNAGMFLWRAGVFLEECERLVPELARFQRDFPIGDFTNFLTEHFPQLPKISVDYAILEKARRVVAVHAGFDWDDVGSWTALPDHLGVDPAGNTFRGQVTTLDSARNIVIEGSGGKRLVALCGVQDLVVIDTPDALLVCHREAVQSVKNLQPILPDRVK